MFASHQCQFPSIGCRSLRGFSASLSRVDCVYSIRESIVVVGVDGPIVPSGKNAILCGSLERSTKNNYINNLELYTVGFLTFLG